MKTATLLLVLALAGCSAESLPPKPRPSRTIQEQAPEVVQNPSGLVTKMVPKEFAPGTYRVEVVPQPGFLESGYFEVCSDYMCMPGGSLLQSEYIPAGGDSVMIVPPNAVMVKLRGLRVKRIDG